MPFRRPDGNAQFLRNLLVRKSSIDQTQNVKLVLAQGELLDHDFLRAGQPLGTPTPKVLWKRHLDRRWQSIGTGVAGHLSKVRKRPIRQQGGHRSLSSWALAIASTRLRTCNFPKI